MARRTPLPPRRAAGFAAAAMTAVLATPAALATGTGPHGAIPPPDLQGRYAPRGDCAREPRVMVDGTGMFLEIGGRRGRVAPLDLCFSCAGGARYSGIEVWVSPKVGDQIPVIFRFNADERRGVLIVEDNAGMDLGPNLRAVIAASPLLRCPRR
ncbi:MAG: hypothetical protein ACK4QW_01705 [Alphaproteobacteria bacterium]